MSKLFFIILFIFHAPRSNFGSDPALFKLIRELSQSGERYESSPYDALLVIQNVEKDDEGKTTGIAYHLPTSVEMEKIKKGESSSNDSFQLKFEKTEDNKQEVFLCPPELPEDKTIIEKLKEFYWGAKYCLLPNLALNGQSKECNQEIKPLIVPKYVYLTNLKTCAGKNNYVIFAYPLCFNYKALQFILPGLEKHKTIKSADDDEPFLPMQPNFEIYGLCINVPSVKTEYTHHQLFPSLLKYENFLANPRKKPEENTESEEILNASLKSIKNFLSSSLNVQEKSEEGRLKFYHENLPEFSEMKTAFENQQDDEFLMMPQMLVPTEDMPFPLWKRTTYTYFNIAPLWKPLVPIMALINDRIRQYAIKYTRKLSVYTALFHFKEVANKRYLDKKKNFLIPNIWAKVVYDEGNKFATLVILHNTPYKDYSKSMLMCEEKEIIPCNFEEWRKTSNLKNNITKEQIEFAMMYAYCCPVGENSRNRYNIATIEGPIIDMNYTPGKDDNIDIMTHRITDQLELNSSEQEQLELISSEDEPLLSIPENNNNLPAGRLKTE